MGAILTAYGASRGDSLIQSVAVGAIIIFIVGPVFADRFIPGWKSGFVAGTSVDLEGDSNFDGGDGGE
jgi:hypothetical protein